MTEDSIDSRILDIANAERELKKQLAEYRAEHEDVFKKVASFEARLAELDDAKQEVKQYLLSHKDYDLHKLDKGVKVSLTPVARVKVTDINLVPDEYKTQQVVVDEKKAKEYLKLFGTTPGGISDNSYYRFNWEDKRD